VRLRAGVIAAGRGRSCEAVSFWPLARWCSRMARQSGSWPPPASWRRSSQPSAMAAAEEDFLHGSPWSQIRMRG